MGIEIERKFLVHHVKWNKLNKHRGQKLIQTYISVDKEKTIRIRVRDSRGFLTIKSNENTIKRIEYEFKIPYKDALQLIKTYGHQKIEKKRYIILFKGSKWEVDVFNGSNKGLIIAEIELKSENEIFQIPPWIKKEVTNNRKYYNSHLQRNPYLSWDNTK